MIDIVDILREKYDISGRQAKKLIKKGCVLLDDKPVNSRYINKSGTDKITVNLKEPEIRYDTQNFFIKQTPNVLFLYKPPFMHTERITPFDPLTLQDIVKNEFPGYKLISRLDFETDGVVAAIRDLPEYSTQKQYLAFICGKLRENIKLSYEIDASHRKKVKVLNREGNNATVFSPIKYFRDSSGEEVTLISVSLNYASRHQIRAFCAHIGMPIVGDSLYGYRYCKRMFLHCKYTKIISSLLNERGIRAFSPNWQEFVKSFD
ncbi:pseudouridine synthase [Flexistipes sinusarabici]|nr:pseudouridine synthase [Flexistipes sinusarabici]